MNKEIAEKWVAALRSGKYEQAKGTLKSINQGGFCCLGVLCDITALGRWEMDSEGHGLQYNTGDSFESAILPVLVMNYVEMNNAAGEVGDTALTEMNDTGMKFPEIADYIERNWEKL